MPLHYKKDGSLDMRYNSSRAAVSAGCRSGNGGRNSFSGSSSGFGSSAYGSSYASPSYRTCAASTDLHYKKDGSLDMRYKSSQESVAAPFPSSSCYYGQTSPPYATSTKAMIPQLTNCHHKKDGSLDMRYKSSKEAVAQQSMTHQSSDNLHYKKDGSLDMRFKSSKLAVGDLETAVRNMNLSSMTSGAHHKQSGTSKKQSMKQFGTTTANMYYFPATVPLKKDGTPDMRRKEAKKWVQEQTDLYARNNILPCWVPAKKDGTVNTANAIGRLFAQIQPVDPSSNSVLSEQKRKEYWDYRMLDELFCELLKREREEPHPMPPPASLLPAPTSIKPAPTSIKPVPTSFMSEISSASLLPAPTNIIPAPTSFMSEISSASLLPAPTDFMLEIPSLSWKQNSASGTVNVPINVMEIDHSSLKFEDKIIGKGAFGVVQKATWNGTEVAVKTLHLIQLTRKEKADFEKEIRILAVVGEHENLVYLHGYCSNPPCIVMELVERGSLSHLLHYCTDPEVEVVMTDGRVKRILMCGVIEGMRQLHIVNIIHGDLKPQNVLVTSGYTAKITDFGLSTLRGKTSSSLRSKEIGDDDEDCYTGVVGGTAGYMAPELLKSTSPPDYPVDVYSFAIVLNEVITEEEPYSDQYRNFAGRGPFGAANYANLGKRPTINKSVTLPFVEDLIEQCWSPEPKKRPTFEKILTVIRDERFHIPDTIHP